jgi:hypothetical protein
MKLTLKWFAYRATTLLASAAAFAFVIHDGAKRW